MTPGERFQASSLKVVGKFANKGVLLQPQDDDYEPTTGKVSYTYTPYAFEYVTVTNKSLPKDSALKVASLRQSLIWFSFTGPEIFRSWGILTVEAASFDPTSELSEPWVDYTGSIWYDEVSEKWVIPFTPNYAAMDIVDLEKVVVNDVIVGYYALLEYKED
ncbi:MAG: hypothetical protein DRP93_05680 [Candidatus Neomarinimicrobiota bacterium]|nr:MAG: hypothetical protein DRP93_05680 [Candidatus Neomarinimicrobiota bacterium]